MIFKHLVIFTGAIVSPVSVYAESEGLADVALRVNNTWLLTAAAMVLIMHLGFATLEAGLTRAKNTVNILFKNFGVLAIGVLTYALCGFGLMYPDFVAGEGMEWFGFRGWGLGIPGEQDPAAFRTGEYTYWSFFLFQAMFAATCATIVSGAVAERIKLSAFLLFSAIYVAAVYPWLGSWVWGNGWLADRGFHDFAGSTVVHSVGGWAALAGVIVLGPRIGKYVNSTVKPIIGHSLPLATIGVFLLWFGWYGFNGGSVLSADPDRLSRVFVMTTLSASAGVVSSMMTSWTVQRKPDLTMMLNGALAGLVGVTAGADVFGVRTAVIVGFISGVLIVLCVTGFDRVRLDDPVGALSVHLVNGVWGTAAVGVFSASHKLSTQLLGVAACGAAAFGSALLIFLALKFTVGVRVGEEEELAGLDLGEHGMEAYTGFQIFTTQ